MAHIHTEKNQHDLTVTAYIIRTDTPEPRALLYMHKKLGVLLPVGGHVELLETPWQAIAHELEEESGYRLSQLHVLQPKSRIKAIANTAHHPNPLSMNTHAISSDHFHTDIEYAFTANADPALNVADGESKDISWLSQVELHELDHTEVFENTKQIYDFIFDEAIREWDAVKTNVYEGEL
jgi:ADP-ribose pyrophosphatase YjhB (NUDIX family)